MKNKMTYHFQYTLFCCLFFSACLFVPDVMAQEEAKPQGMSSETYQAALEAKVDDLDNDTYVKISDGAYVLDRYEMKPPYMITGDSGVKKRIDLYKMVDRETMNELGMVAFFTDTEASKTFNLVIPNLASSAEVWNMYFDAIHAHDREEKDVALKMSYILSKEMAYLMQKSSGADMSAMEQANDDYDFCFPASAMVSLGDGSAKSIAEIVPGDKVRAYDQGKLTTAQVAAVNVHRSAHIPLTKVMLFPVEEVTAAQQGTYYSAAIALVATPNHPVLTQRGKIKAGALKMGDVLYCLNNSTQQFEPYQVHAVANRFETTPEVYSISTSRGNHIVQNMVVLDK